MGGIKGEDMSTNSKLLNLMTSDLKGPFSCLVESLGMLQGAAAEHYLSLMIELRKYLNSEISDDIDWAGYQFSGQSCYSSNLRFQMNLIIQIIKCAKKVGLNIRNSIIDFKGINIDLVLFGFILCKLLLLIVECCDGDDEIEISAAKKENRIVISITASGATLFKKLGQICLNYSVETADTKANTTLNSCYEILSINGGNLWSESSELEGLKLYFSMPANKKH